MSDSSGSFTWSEIFTPESGKVKRSGIDRATNIYYAGTSRGEIWAAPSGEGWVRIFEHPSEQELLDIAFDATDPAVFYASFNGRNHDNRVFRFVRSSPTTDAVLHSNITSDLPRPLQVHAVEPDRRRPFTLYVGTNQGVYRGTSSNLGVTWTWEPFNNGLPFAAQITELEAHPITGVLRAITFGRGAYFVETALPSQLWVNLEVLPPGDPGRFNLRIDDVTQKENAKDGSTIFLSTIAPGSHTVGQTAGPGTNLSDYVTVFGGACLEGGALALGPGDEKVCTISNLARNGEAACLATCDAKEKVCLNEGFLLRQECPNSTNHACCPAPSKEIPN